MVMFTLPGKINEHGKLEVDLPEGIAPEDVLVTIESLADNADAATPFWTEEELAILNAPHSPKTGAEIAARIREEGGGWEDLGITDSEAYIQELRRKRRDSLK
ncbi:MAG: hypothetical protein SF123_25785 [Chloroflexota bacterium]|nr:hypothetical protein [Chloroflexota bacterium]